MGARLPASRPGHDRARHDNKPAVSIPRATIRHDPRPPGPPHRPAAPGRQDQAVIRYGHGVARRVADPSARQFTPDTPGALGNPDSQQPDINDP